MSHLKGARISLVRDLGEYDVHWRDARPVGYLEVGQVLTYTVSIYATEAGQEVAVFVQKGKVLDKYLVVTGRLQYGDAGGRPFLVYHDKEKYQPCQQSFLCAGVPDLLPAPDRPPEEDEGGPVPSFGFAFSWGLLEKLNDFE